MFMYIFDGAMGTMLQAAGLEEGYCPELFNIERPEVVKDIHVQYLQHGSDVITTNTFGACGLKLEDYDLQDRVREINIAAVKVAKEAIAENKPTARVAGSMGPTGRFLQPLGNMSFDSIYDTYREQAEALIEGGVDFIIIETIIDVQEMRAALLASLDAREAAGKTKDDVQIICQFSFSEDGRTITGTPPAVATTIVEAMGADIIGINCSLGPEQITPLIEEIASVTNLPISCQPNAGMPQLINKQTVFPLTAEEMGPLMLPIVDAGASYVGGCCGTTPEHIRRLSAKTAGMTKTARRAEQKICENEKPVQNNAFYRKKERTGKKLIAVELAPPLGSDDKKLMEAAHALRKSDVDVLTFPDSPSGRTRVDSILMAEKVSKETGMCVMPHLCCRDKNAIAMRSQLLGAHINGIDNFLVVTGDPVPAVARQTVKAVFNFNSIGLMNIIHDMNTEQFADSPVVFGGAINQNRRNLNVEIDRIRKKMEMGADFFFTQPVFTEKGVNLLRQIKEETGARILCGVMPFVSRRNAVFMKNEMTGIEVDEQIIARYPENATKEEGEAVGIEIAREVMAQTADFVDGYYFSFPFNRVYLLEKILQL